MEMKYQGVIREYITGHCSLQSYIPVSNSGVIDKPVCSFSFVSGKNNKIRKEYLGTGY